MGAFVVSNEHIAAMLLAAQPMYSGDRCEYYWRGKSHSILDNLVGVGQKLLDENVRSVNFRYDEDNESPKFRVVPFCGISSWIEVVRLIQGYSHQACGLSWIEVAKLINGYDYQACEHPGYKDSEAKVIVDLLLNRAIRRLPGYEEAHWSI